MNSARYSVYQLPHKGVREALAQLTRRVGTTIYADAHARAELRLFGQRVCRVLTLHAQDEENFTLARLAARVPGADDHDRDTHDRLEHLQAEVEQHLETVCAAEPSLSNIDSLAQAVHILHAHHLLHMTEEETITLPLLWQHFTDEELATNHRDIMAELTPEDKLLWFRFVLPAIDAAARTAFLQGVRANSPATFWAEVEALLAEINLNA